MELKIFFGTTNLYDIERTYIIFMFVVIKNLQWYALQIQSLLSHLYKWQSSVCQNAFYIVSFSMNLKFLST